MINKDGKIRTDLAVGTMGVMEAGEAKLVEDHKCNNRGRNQRKSDLRTAIRAVVGHHDQSPDHPNGLVTSKQISTTSLTDIGGRSMSLIKASKMA